MDTNIQASDTDNHEEEELTPDKLEKALEVVRNLRTELPDLQLDLHRANLREFDLRGMDFRVANMREAQLSSANLSGANLSGVDLGQAELAKANLEAADMHGAYLFLHHRTLFFC